MKRNYLFILLILFFISASVVGAYWYEKNNSITIPFTPSIQTTPQVTISQMYPTVVTKTLIQVSPTIYNSKCVVDGCSGQYCIDELKGGNFNTTCEWEEIYACFRTAECKRQSNGQCGWTQTSQLNECLVKNK